MTGTAYEPDQARPTAPTPRPPVGRFDRPVSHARRPAASAPRLPLLAPPPQAPQPARPRPQPAPAPRPPAAQPTLGPEAPDHRPGRAVLVRRRHRRGAVPGR